MLEEVFINEALVHAGRRNRLLFCPTPVAESQVFESRCRCQPTDIHVAIASYYTCISEATTSLGKSGHRIWISCAYSAPMSPPPWTSPCRAMFESAAARSSRNACGFRCARRMYRYDRASLDSTHDSSRLLHSLSRWFLSSAGAAEQTTITSPRRARSQRHFYGNTWNLGPSALRESLACSLLEPWAASFNTSRGRACGGPI